MLLTQLGVQAAVEAHARGHLHAHMVVAQTWPGASSELVSRCCGDMGMLGGEQSPVCWMGPGEGCIVSLQPDPP